ncbi:MAG: hypothetical protein Q9P14_14710 [candidate division KSB1 bacterium]|nr:hypothetical protein [candidate division KSB1 bacterium]
MISVTQIGGTAYPSVELDDRPYVKFTIGGDYTFPGGVYLNAQWMHGFFTERGSEALHDYLLAQLKKKYFDDVMELALGAGLEVADWGTFRDRYGYGLFPELIYRPADNLAMTIGFFIVDGRDGSLFGAWRETDQVYARVKLVF